MKKTFLPFLLIIGVTSSAFAQQTCPLTNSKLTDLRVAASNLAKVITLSAECQSYQNTINQANSDLKAIANKIKDAEDARAAEVAADNGTAVVSDTKTDAKRQLAIEAVAQMNTINSVFSSKKCGQEAANFLDYADAFTDVVVGITPYLALYGGSEAAPWVLGPAIGAAAVKSLISFFKNKAVNMRNPDQSNNFIKNSCSFYTLNVIKNSLDEVQLNQTPRIQNDFILAKAKLAEMNNNPFPKPNNSLSKDLNLAEKDSSRLKYLQDQIKVDQVEGCSYIEAYVNETDKDKDGSMLSRVWNNYEKVSDPGFKLDLEKKYFQQDLTATLAATPDKCSTLGVKWINKMLVFNDTALAALRKQADEDKQVKDYRAWAAEKDNQKLLVQALEAKLKFFDEMTAQGFNIEYSEIIRSHDQVQDSLFQSYRYIKLLKMKGLAEAWLRVKYEDADQNMSEFDDRKKEVEERIGNITKTMGLSSPTDLSRASVSNFVQSFMAKNHKENPVVTKSVLVDVCTQLRTTWSAWYNGLVHARAGRDYCVAFDNVINKLDYPDVQTLCFGTNDKRGKKMSSLKNQVAQITMRKVEADQIVSYMNQFGCRAADDASPDMLKSSLK